MDDQYCPAEWVILSHDEISVFTKLPGVRNHVVNCDIQQELTKSKYAVYNREREGKTVFLF